jgi:predicted DNA-binding protein
VGAAGNIAGGGGWAGVQALVLRLCQNRVTISFVKGISIKLPESTLRRLQEEAKATGRSVAALVRERVEAPSDSGDHSVFALTSDLAGSLKGAVRAATNERRKFKRA